MNRQAGFVLEWIALPAHTHRTFSRGSASTGNESCVGVSNDRSNAGRPPHHCTHPDKFSLIRPPNHLAVCDGLEKSWQIHGEGMEMLLNITSLVVPDGDNGLSSTGPRRDRAVRHCPLLAVPVHVRPPANHISHWRMVFGGMIGGREDGPRAAEFCGTGKACNLRERGACPGLAIGCLPETWHRP